MLSQKDAVYRAIVAYLSENGRIFEDGDALNLSPSDRKTIVTMIVEAISSGQVEFSRDAATKHSTPEKLRNYTTGLLSNWLRKDSRLNGGAKHEIKNPGARVGQDDILIKKLKELKKLLTRTSDILKVDAEISIRLKQIQAEKEPKVNKDLIPDNLQYLVK